MTAIANPAEDARVRVGLSKPQFDRLRARYLPPEPSLDEERKFLAKLVRAHERFRERVIARIEMYSEEHGGYLTTSEVAEISGMGEFQVANLRRRGKLRSVTPAGERYPHYPREDVLAFIDRKPSYREHHNPLSWAFLRYFERTYRVKPPDGDDDGEEPPSVVPTRIGRPVAATAMAASAS